MQRNCFSVEDIYLNKQTTYGAIIKSTCDFNCQDSFLFFHCCSVITGKSASGINSAQHIGLQSFCGNNMQDETLSYWWAGKKRWDKRNCCSHCFPVAEILFAFVCVLNLTRVTSLISVRWFRYSEVKKVCNRGAFKFCEMLYATRSTCCY